ncbi:hypothetical protein Tco_0611755 [Tanacetum coccineum]
MALMAFSDSKLNQTEFKAATYKRGLATVEEQLVTYRKNEVLFSEEVAVIKRDVTCKDYEISVLKSEFEKVKQEKEGIEFKIEKFNSASKSLDKLLGSQITNKSKKGLGYHAVPPPHPLIYNAPTKLDLSYSGLYEFKEPEFKGCGPRDSKLESNIVCDSNSDDSKENFDDSLVKEQVSEDTSSFVESPLNGNKETVFPTDKKIEFVKPKNHENPVKNSVRPRVVNTARPPTTVGHIMESDDIEVVDFSTTSPQSHDDEVTLAKTLVNIKMSATKDKGKAIMQEFEPLKKIMKKEMIQIGHDEELAQKLHAKELAKDTARQEQEKYDIEKALELQKQLDEREKVVAKSQAHNINWSDPTVLRYHAVQNRSFSIAEVRNNMCIYLKNQGGYKKSHFKGMRYEDTRPIFERDDLEKLTLMEYVEVIYDSKEVISVIPLVVKSPIVSKKSYCKGDVGYYEIYRADGSYKTYIFFRDILNDFDREDLIVLYKIFNEKYTSTRLDFDDLMLWGYMKIMFEPNNDDAVWKNHHSQELIEWKLYDSCGVHSLMLGEVSIHILVEKKYPLPQDTLTRMLQWKLHVNYDVTKMAYKLLRFIRSQLNQ